MQTLIQQQQAEFRRIKANRAARKPTGLAAFLGRITGVQKLIEWKHAREDAATVKSDQQARHLLEQRHNLQLMDLDLHFRAADRLDAYEKRSLDSLLRKEQLQTSIHKYREDTKSNSDSLQAEDARSRAIKKARNAINQSQKQRKDLGRNH